METFDGLTLTVSAGFISTVSGLLGAWLQSNRTRRIEPQPLQVRTVSDLEQLGSRTGKLEIKVAANEARLLAIEQTLQRLENKLDIYFQPDLGAAGAWHGFGTGVAKAPQGE